MAAPRTCFLDLPSEIRNQVYELYLDEVDERTVLISSSGFLPPSIVRTSGQVRKEFESYWSRKVHDLHDTASVKARVIDLDFRPLMTFIDRAGTMLSKLFLFHDVIITLSFTESYRRAECRARLQEWLDWSEEDGPPIWAEGSIYRAELGSQDAEAGDGLLPISSSLTGEEQLMRMKWAVVEACVAPLAAK